MQTREITSFVLNKLSTYVHGTHYPNMIKINTTLHQIYYTEPIQLQYYSSIKTHFMDLKISSHSFTEMNVSFFVS